MNRIVAPRIPTYPNITPRQAIFVESGFAADLPISGGWGYSKEDAVVIEGPYAKDPTCQPSNLLNVEYSFVEHRLAFELRLAQPNSCAERKHKLVIQTLSIEGGRYFDTMTFDVLADLWESPRLVDARFGQAYEASRLKYTVVAVFDVSLLFKNGKYCQM